MKYRAVKDNVLVVLDRCDEELLASGLIKPATETTPIEAKMARVIASGPGTPYEYHVFEDRPTEPVEASPRVATGFIPNETRPGMHVLLESRHGGQPVPVETLLHLGLDPERHYRIVREAEIAGVLEQ